MHRTLFRALLEAIRHTQKTRESRTWQATAPLHFTHFISVPQLRKPTIAYTQINATDRYKTTYCMTLSPKSTQDYITAIDNLKYCLALAVEHPHLLDDQLQTSCLTRFAHYCAGVRGRNRYRNITAITIEKVFMSEEIKALKQSQLCYQVMHLFCNGETMAAIAQLTQTQAILDDSLDLAIPPEYHGALLAFIQKTIPQPRLNTSHRNPQALYLPLAGQSQSSSAQDFPKLSGSPLPPSHRLNKKTQKRQTRTAQRLTHKPFN